MARVKVLLKGREIPVKASTESKTKLNDTPKGDNGEKGESKTMENKWADWIGTVEYLDGHVKSKEDKMFLYSVKLLSNDKISVPSKMDLFAGLDITEKDQLKVTYKGVHSNTFHTKVLLINGKNRIVGVFRISSVLIEGKVECFLVADARNMDFTEHDSTKYSFIFCDTAMRFYEVPIEVSYFDTETTNTHLCIDFGTSNTTAGCFLDDHYVSKVSNIAVINENICLNSENIALFTDRGRENSADEADTLVYRSILPTIVYVDDCSDLENIKYLYGYEASRRIKDDNYCPKASCFMEIKRWTSNMDVNEEIQDTSGNKAMVSRREVIAKYLMYVIRTVENQFKCRFKNVHISAPVKLKDKVLDLYADILKEQGYTLEKEHAIDEGIAVLYSIISNQIKGKKYINGEEEKALIIDCGGGTSDLASCRYRIEKDEDGIINLDIVTEYMNGDVNFGGNNLTYRIMQYMKIVYACQIEQNQRINIDNLITQDVNGLFSYIEGEMENDDDANVKRRYEEVYHLVSREYQKAEEVIPTRYKEYENKSREMYDKVKNNFYFLWKLAEEMKKEFYRSTSISRYKFYMNLSNNKDIDLHINRIENWRLSTVQKDGSLKEQTYPDITFTAKEIDKLIRADIYYLVRKFLNELYMNKTLDTYSQIKLSGQSSKINIFMDALKEFLPGKKIKSGRIDSKGNDAEELKLLCLRGAVMYLHALEKSNIEVVFKNETRNIPITVYIRNENDEDKEMFRQGSDWNQPAVRRRITAAGKEVYLYMKNTDKEIRQPYKYVYENMQYRETEFEELQRISGKRIKQKDIDDLAAGRKYIFVFLNKEKWGFDILPVYRDGKGKLFKGNTEFCSFEMDILQETFFDGKR